MERMFIYIWADYWRLAVFVVFAAAGIPALFNIYRQHGWGAAILLFGIYVATVFIAVK